ncbi:SUMF1/EgtB/PvdO family nonheme iron enzyme [Streptomyces sp. NPDC000151]|uniref:SUMF1/EgtB/PvdO family nonheme iron enzyme n=1 Tax=Streptomyces sp. NPDC000151 TaxID=3154244 RepID=UPI00331C9B1E
MGLVAGARLSTGHEVREVRRGGFSEVGVVEGRLGERLAVKRIRGEIRERLGEAADQAFLHECQLAVARLGNAPYTARPVLALPALELTGEGAAEGDAAAGRVALGPALFMEYVDGPSLEDLLAAGRLAPGQAARICGGVAAALAHAHEAKVCHRDIKPTNVLLTRGNEVRLIDWGLSGAGQFSDVTTRIEFISPERLAQLDLAEPPDDVYALGMLFHLCLTGRLVNHWPGGASEALRAELAAPGADVPEELAHIVVSMLAPRAEDRPTARSLADMLLHEDMARALADRDLDRPYCPDCGHVVGSAPATARCPVCGGGLLRRVPDAQAEGMVRIAAGTFVHGLSDSQARHALIAARMTPDDEQVRRLTGGSGPRRVFCRAFDIDRTPVTNAQYAAFVRAVNYPEPPGFGAVLAEAPDHPVTSVSWRDALCYALWRGKRLPTPLEWEKAARGPDDDRMYPWGSAFERERCQGLPGGAGPRTVRTLPVGSLPGGQSPWGVLDMSGNVNEWVAEGTVPEYRGVRGGATGEVLEVYGLVSYQSQARTDHVDAAIGFRCAADVTHGTEPYVPGGPPDSLDALGEAGVPLNSRSKEGR